MRTRCGRRHLGFLHVAFDGGAGEEEDDTHGLDKGTPICGSRDGDGERGYLIKRNVLQYGTRTETADTAVPTGSLNHWRTMLPMSSNQPLPAKQPNHAT